MGRLPRWWTDNPPASRGHVCTHAELVAFYSGPFVVNVLGHTGGINTLPSLEKEDELELE